MQALTIRQRSVSAGRGGDGGLVLAVDQQQLAFPAHRPVGRRSAAATAPASSRVMSVTSSTRSRGDRDVGAAVDDQRRPPARRRAGRRPCRGGAGGTSGCRPDGRRGSGRGSRTTAPGSMRRKGLSLLPCGETRRPWVCRLVGWSSRLVSRTASSSPGRTRSVGPGELAVEAQRGGVAAGQPDAGRRGRARPAADRRGCRAPAAGSAPRRWRRAGTRRGRRGGGGDPSCGAGDQPGRAEAAQHQGAAAADRGRCHRRSVRRR